MIKRIVAQELTKEAFAPFGDVIEKSKANSFEINNGMCRRFHDLANVQLGGTNPRPLISIFTGQSYTLPLRLEMVERHPLGSQAFFPLSDVSWLVIVCPDNDGTPGLPRAFHLSESRGVNLRMNVWHGVLTPLDGPADFLVFDRGGEGNNLEEHHFAQPYEVVLDT